MSKRPNPRKNPNKTAKQNNDGSQENKGTGNNTSSSAEVKPPPFKPEETHDEHAERTVGGPVIERIRTTLKWINWWRVFEGVGILAGITYAAVTLVEWRDLRHNFEVDQRAWIQILQGLPAPGTIKEDTVIGGVPVTLKNVGKSAAFRSIVNTVFEIVGSGNEPTLNFNRAHSVADVGLLFPEGTIDPVPSAFHGANGQPRTLSKAEIQQLLDGTSYLVVYTMVSYSDPFGPHWTRVCAWKDYSPDPHVYNADSCVRWGSVGDGEPPN